MFLEPATMHVLQKVYGSHKVWCHAHANTNANTYQREAFTLVLGLVVKNRSQVAVNKYVKY